jgi:signal transduction histidine kinase
VTEAFDAMDIETPSLAQRRSRPAQPRSLRLRLALWYGTLLAVALALFAALILLLTTNAIDQNVDGGVRAESRIATLDLAQRLSPTAPYWPETLTLPAVDTYRDPGVIVEVRDLQGNVRYRSASGGDSVPLNEDAIQAAARGQAVGYTARSGGERVRVEALPIRAPTATAQGTATPTAGEGGVSADGAPLGSGAVIGVLLIGKSLGEVDSALRLLRTLLALTGAATLAIALLIAWAIAARVLRPLGAVSATARAIAIATARGARASGLSRRVKRPDSHDELAQLVDTFNEMLTALEAANATQRRFVADASHELRAPLTTMQGNLAFLQRHANELPPDERRTMLADAHAETLRLARLVDELLLLARADASADGPKTPDAPELEAPSRAEPPVELDRAVLQLVRQLRGRLSAEGSKLNLEVGHIEPARVRGDEETLRRIALILLDNAIKYTPARDGAPGRITVSLEVEEGQAVLRVRDTGAGIAPGDLPHIFERFYRADQARDRQGTGLGLSIAQTLVERLGGRISAESELGMGSVFSVHIPLA